MTDTPEQRCAEGWPTEKAKSEMRYARKADTGIGMPIAKCYRTLETGAVQCVFCLHAAADIDSLLHGSFRYKPYADEEDPGEWFCPVSRAEVMIIDAVRHDLRLAERFAEESAEQAADLARLREVAYTVRSIVDRQAEDDGLWFVAEHATEAYLQDALRKLHAALEGRDARP